MWPIEEPFDTEPEEDDMDRYEYEMAELEKQAYPGPSNAKVDEAIKEREKEAAWLERRLETLILSDEDRQQTQDEVKSLKDEIKSLKEIFRR